jgi:hypothetical protein
MLRVGKLCARALLFSILVWDSVFASTAINSYLYDKVKDKSEYDLLYATNDCDNYNAGECAVIAFNCEKVGISITLYAVSEVDKRQFLDAVARKRWDKLLVQAELSRTKYSYYPWSFEIAHNDMSGLWDIGVKIANLDSDFTEAAAKGGLELVIRIENLTARVPLGGEHTRKWEGFRRTCAGQR